jgi:hypothetical protein
MVSKKFKTNLNVTHRSMVACQDEDCSTITNVAGNKQIKEYTIDSHGHLLIHHTHISQMNKTFSANNTKDVLKMKQSLFSKMASTIPQKTSTRQHSARRLK